MTKTVELIVGLKIPDTTAITAFHTLENIGYKELKNLKREEYYKFEIEGDVEDFKNKISKVDILVNANKNDFKFEVENEENDYFNIKVLIKNIDNGKGILKTLQERLGFENIKKIEKGVLWTLSLKVKDIKEAMKIADKITHNLLRNEHYQTYKILDI
jgi:phosphoribosylformylglycinamidine (FGAM) synthase PurS component